MRKLSHWTSIPASVFVFAVLVAAGCGGGGAETTTTPAGIFTTVEKGTLTVGAQIPNPPFVFGSAARYEGLDVDLLNEIGRRLGLRPKFVSAAPGDLLDDLDNDKFDLVDAPPLTAITPSALQVRAFAGPYLSADLSLVVEKGSDIRAMTDLTGRELGVQAGGPAADYAKQVRKARTVRTFGSPADVLKALSARQIDAALLDYPIALYALRSHPDIEIAETVASGELYGFAFKGSSDYLEKSVNNALDGMKGDGTFESIYRKWLKQAPPHSLIR